MSHQSDGGIDSFSRLSLTGSRTSRTSRRDGGIDMGMREQMSLLLAPRTHLPMDQIQNIHRNRIQNEPANVELHHLIKPKLNLL